MKGYICTKKGIIVETGKGKPPVKPVAKGYIIPSPFNAHTHIGDAFIRKEIKELPRDIEKLVAPPNGLKHEMLKQTPDDVVLRGMRKVLHEMVEVGISMFCDFREGGIKGINLLRE
ncbi:MAG TPA: chlorohydrolase, partial [Thermoplasmatales archaeon]|nr:chlorohydrolase [Thermoplasmatales archaeon]